MTHPTYSELYKEFEAISEKCISQIKTLVGRKKIKFSNDNEFEDETNNTLVAVNKNEVFFDNGSGEVESYPIEDLGITDALHIIHILESQFV